MGHVVISYSREDSEFVDRLVGALEAAGVGVWIDRQSISSGDWEAKIEAAITTASDMILVVSARSKRSARCRDEFAFAREVLDDDHIHPVILEPAPWMGLSRYHQHDATDGAVPTELVDHLRPAATPRATHVEPRPAPTLNLGPLTRTGANPPEPRSLTRPSRQGPEHNAWLDLSDAQWEAAWQGPTTPLTGPCMLHRGHLGSHSWEQRRLRRPGFEHDMRREEACGAPSPEWPGQTPSTWVPEWPS